MDQKTVFVTGASGFIAKHIVLGLLERGHRVRGSVRSPERGDEVRRALAPHLADPAALDRLDFVTLDLERDAGWDAALAGADVLMHTASPFPMVQPKNADALIRPAVDGALRALRAARNAGVGRVILTSSSAAIMSSDLPAGRSQYTEEDWTDLSRPDVSPYERSKTMAERAAWDFARDEAPGMALTAINPVFVLGPALDGAYGTSVRVIERLLAAKDPMLPNFGFPTVDVRDVALAHIRAMERPETAGRRYIVSDSFLWFADMARLIKAAFPERRIVTRVAPNAVIRLLGLFDPAIRTIVPALGKRDEISNARARAELGIAFRPAGEAVVETARSLIARGTA